MHRLEDFKGFESTSLNLFKPLTVLIGPNGSGKSNVIEGIELLSFIARGGYLHEVVELGRGGPGLEIRGGLKACARFGTSRFTLGFDARAPFDGQQLPVSYRVTIETLPTPRIHYESLIIDERTVIFTTPDSQVRAASADIRVSYANFDKGRNDPQTFVAANRSVLSQYKQFALKNKKKESCDALVEIICQHLRASFVFDPKPHLMRKYEKIGDIILQRNGSNLSSVLFGLQNEGDILELLATESELKLLNEKRAKLARLREWICKLPEESFSDFEFVTTALHDVIFGLRSVSSSTLVDASILSDGTLRSLAFLTALETVDEGSRIIMEEFDNGIHPSRIATITHAMSECSKRRNLNVLVTTHNPATLNSLEKDQLTGVTFSAWDKERTSYRMVQLTDLPRLPELLESGRLGDLVTKSLVEEYLSPHLDEEKKAAISRWIARSP